MILETAAWPYTIAFIFCFPCLHIVALIPLDAIHSESKGIFLGRLKQTPPFLKIGLY